MSRADFDRLKSELLNKPESFVYIGPNLLNDDIAEGIKRHMDDVAKRIADARRDARRRAISECAAYCEEGYEIGLEDCKKWLRLGVREAAAGAGVIAQVQEANAVYFRSLLTADTDTDTPDKGGEKLT